MPLRHGTFDFSIMAIPALAAADWGGTGGGGDSTAAAMVLALMCAAACTVVASWVHLARATAGLERALSAAGYRAPAAGLPRLGTCSGQARYVGAT